jgi:hypothetical protein
VYAVKGNAVELHAEWRGADIRCLLIYIATSAVSRLAESNFMRSKIFTSNPISKLSLDVDTIIVFVVMCE